MVIAVVISEGIAIILRDVIGVPLSLVVTFVAKGIRP